MRTSEHALAVRLANRILDRPSGDPDDDLAVLSRQFLHADERRAAARLAGALAMREKCAVTVLAMHPSLNHIAAAIRSTEPEGVR